jgi:hypothetical protein
VEDDVVEVIVEGWACEPHLCTIRRESERDIRVAKISAEPMDTARAGVYSVESRHPQRVPFGSRGVVSSWEVNVEIATSQSLSRIWRLALVGAATAFAWMILSLLFGLGSDHARADDADDNSLLGAVTSVVDQTAGAVTGTVSTVTTGVTEAVNTVVAVAPAPVQAPVRDAVKAVGSVVTTVTQPVSDAVSGGVVGTVTQPVVEVVTQVPIVGDVVSGVGLDDAADDLAGSVDDSLSELVGAVTDTGSAVGLPPSGPVPGLPGLPTAPSIPVGGHPLPALDVALPADAGADDAVASGAARDAASALSAFLAACEPRSATDAIVVRTAVSAADSRGSSTPAGVLCPPSALSSGPGGTGSGAWALVAFGPLVALRAWVRRAGPEDEHAPPAPAGSTDVSPD